MSFCVALEKLDLFLNLGSFTNSVSQVVELCSSYLTGTNNLYLNNVRRVDREGLLNATTIRYASYGEGLGDAAAVLSNYSALEELNSLTCAFLDSVVDTNSITNVYDRDLGLKLLVCKSLK